jgi:hypothetical protein
LFYVNERRIILHWWSDNHFTGRRLPLEFKRFAEKIGMESQSELDRVLYASYYICVCKELVEFCISDVINLLESFGFAKINKTRLVSNMTRSSIFTKGASQDTFKIAPVTRRKIQTECLDFFESTEIKSNSELLDESLLFGYRGYIDLLVKQINCCYACNIFDGCAVLMRRLFEILLILSYIYNKIESAIENTDGTYLMLDGIVKKCKEQYYT